LVPGVASKRCIEANHALSQKVKATPGDPNNLIHDDLAEAASYVKIDFLFNVIVNHQRDIIAAVAGHIQAAHQQGMQIVRSRFLVPVNKCYDLVIVSAGGYPKDMQMYQVIKTLKN